MRERDDDDDGCDSDGGGGCDTAGNGGNDKDSDWDDEDSGRDDECGFDREMIMMIIVNMVIMKKDSDGITRKLNVRQ